MSLVPFQNFPDGSPQKARHTRKSDSESSRHTRKSDSESSRKTRKEDPTPKATRKKYTTHVSKTSGKTFYVTADGESTWDKPASESEREPQPAGLPEGFEIRTSRSTGEQYYYDRTTGDSMWELPRPQTFVPGSIPHLLERAEDRVMNSFGIMTCREIKHMLDTSELTEAEQVKFIEDNAKDTSILRKYIRACNLNPDQLNVISNAAPMIVVQIQTAVYSLVRENTEPPVETDDPDAEPECAILRAKVNKFYKKGTGITKRMWTAFINAATEVVTTLSSMTYDAFVALYNSFPTSKQWLYMVQWFVSKAIDISAWICANPKIAYYIMLALKQVKDKGCQLIGEACKTLEWDPAQNEFIKYLQFKYPEALDVSQKESLGEQLLEFLQPLIETTVIKGAAFMVQGVCTSVAGGVAAGVTGGGSTAALSVLAATQPWLAFVGAFSMAAVSLSVNEAATQIKSQVQSAADGLVHVNEIRNAYSKLVELCNPLPCILAILKVTEAAQGERRLRHVTIWKTIANDPLYATTNTTVGDIPSTALRFKKLLLALDETTLATYNKTLTIGQVHSLLDKYSRTPTTTGGSKTGWLGQVKTAAAQTQALGQALGNRAVSTANYVTTTAASAASNVQGAYTNVTGSIVKSTLYRSIYKNPQTNVAAVRELANTQYYTVTDMWAQVGIYVWLLQSQLIDASNTTDFGNLKNLSIKEYNGIEAKCKADFFKESAAEVMTALNQWKVEFNDLKYSWDSFARLESYAGTPPPTLIVSMLLMKLKPDVKAFLDSLGEKRRETLKGGFPLILGANPYTLAALAMHHLEDPATPLYYEEFPVWLNECFRALKEKDRPQYYQAVKVPKMKDIEIEYAAYLKAVGEHDTKQRFKGEQQQVITSSIDVIHKRYERYLNAYYAFKIAGTADAQRLCIEVKRAVEIPLRIVARVIQLDSANPLKGHAGYTQKRKYAFIELMKCILGRLDAPFLPNPKFQGLHKFTENARAKLQLQSLLTDTSLDDLTFRRSIVNMWMFVKEAEIYGYSKSYARHQSAEYQAEFQLAVRLRLDYENDLEDIKILEGYALSLAAAVDEMAPKENDTPEESKIKTDLIPSLEKEAMNATIEKDRLEAGLEKKFQQASRSIQRVYEMDTRPKYYLPRTNTEKYASFLGQEKYMPTTFDAPLWDRSITGGRKEGKDGMHETAKDMAQQVRVEESAHNDKWKKEMAGDMEIFAERAKTWMATDSIAASYEPKVRFTPCFLPKKYDSLFASALSGFSHAPFSGAAYDPLLNYYNPKDLRATQDHLTDVEQLQYYDDMESLYPCVVYIREDKLTRQRFTDLKNPTVYQIFNDLGLPHPSIPWSKWSTFFNLPQSDQDKITYQLVNTVVDGAKLF